jgi:hypothetical protein
MHPACSQQKLIYYHSTRYHTPEGQNFIPHHHKNPKYKFSVIPVVVEELLQEK